MARPRKMISLEAQIKKQEETVLKVKEKYNCWLHAYCLMTNHVHLLIETGDIEIGKFMKYMSECYAIYYNHKYGYRGHVFENRYKSCLVKED